MERRVHDHLNFEGRDSESNGPVYSRRSWVAASSSRCRLLCRNPSWSRYIYGNHFGSSHRYCCSVVYGILAVTAWEIATAATNVTSCNSEEHSIALATCHGL